MAQIILNQSRVITFVREVVAAAVAQHVRMHVAELRLLAGDAQQIIHRLPRHRRATLRQEQPRQSIVARAQIGLDRAQLVAGERMLHIEPAFQAAHVDARLFQIDLVFAQADRFTHPQAVPVHQQHQQIIAFAVAAAPRGFAQLFDFTFTQEIFFALVRVNGIGFQ